MPPRECRKRLRKGQKPAAAVSGGGRKHRSGPSAWCRRWATASKGASGTVCWIRSSDRRPWRWRGGKSRAIRAQPEWTARASNGSRRKPRGICRNSSTVWRRAATGRTRSNGWRSPKATGEPVRWGSRRSRACPRESGGPDRADGSQNGHRADPPGPAFGRPEDML
jgi:hypothetical protein